jgi:hypothetical protein
MNYSILQKELVLLMGNIDSFSHQNIGNGSIVFPQDFFNVPAAALPTSHNSFVNGTAFSGNHFPQTNGQISSKGQYRTSIGQKDNSAQGVVKDNIKNSRKDKVVSLLGAGKPMGIKDFAKEIKDCSEKTIQRELLAMVESGVLKKTGERRWSLYSLV